MTFDVEEWFHIVGAPGVPGFEQWSSLDSRVAASVDRILALLSQTDVRATFFWLGWLAERQKDLVRRCLGAGHEIASHGYAHVIAYEVGREAFREDITRSKRVLEDVTGEEVRGFRAPSFSIVDESRWAFDALREAGYRYDASVFPARRGFGGMINTPLEPHVIRTAGGDLVECPMSVVEIFGRRACLFSGGYFRLAPLWLIRWGVRSLEANRRPVIFLVHPREVDLDHPRLPLPLKRTFMCYVNLHTTFGKLRRVCHEFDFVLMRELADTVARRHAPDPQAELGRAGDRPG